MRRAPSGLVRAGGGASRSRPRCARRPRTSAVVRRRDGQPARRVRQRVRRAPVPGPAARRQHVASPAVAGTAGRSPGLAHRCPPPMPGGFGAADTRPVRQGGAAPPSWRPRAGGGRGPRHHRGLAGPGRRGDGHRPRSRVDLHVDGPRLAEREATFDDGTCAGGVATGDRRRYPPLRGRPGAGARRGGRRPGSVARGGRRARPCARGVIAVLHHLDRVLDRRRPRAPCRSPSPRTPCCWAGASAPPRRAGTWPWPPPSPSASAAGRISRSRCSTTPSPGSRAVGDTFGIGYALGQRGHTLRWAGDLAGALACFDAAEQVHRSLRDLRSIAMAVAGRSYVAALLGEATIARRHVEEAVSMMERSGDIAGVAHTLNIQGLIELELGVVDAALPPLERSLLLADRGVTPVYAIGWEYLLVAHLRQRRRRRRRIGSCRGRGGGAIPGARRSARSASPAKSAQSRCRHDAVLTTTPKEDDMTQAARRRDHQRARGGTRGFARAARRR